MGVDTVICKRLSATLIIRKDGALGFSIATALHNNLVT